MLPLIAFALAAAVPQLGVPPQLSAQPTVRATAEILRAETSSPDPGEGGARRQIRRRANGQISIEFE